jgi:hypothetical protein
MAWEWVAPVVTGAVGLGGIVFTWLTGKQSRDQALATLRQQLGHDRLQAREAREQERLESAYLELLKMAEQAGVWAQMVYPVFQSGQPPNTPLPSLDVQADAAALVAAFGTDEIREKTQAWQSVVKEMIAAAEQVAWEDAHPTQVPPQGKSARVTIHELRPDEKRTRDALGAQVRSELAFGYRSTREPSGFVRSHTMPPTGQQDPGSQSTTAESPEQ